MWWSFLLPAAFAGQLVAEVKVPVRLVIDGEVVAEVYREGLLRLEVPAGRHDLIVTTEGVPRSFSIEVSDDAPLVVLVGRSGTTVGGDDPRPTVRATGEATVRFRSAGKERLLVQVGRQRVVVMPGAGVTLPLPLGDHDISVRSPDGTSIFARGVLTVAGGDDLVVQVAEGRLPETAGEGLSFTASGP